MTAKASVSWLAATESVDDPVLHLVVERALEGSRPGQRFDSARVALAIEGGGMAGAVSAGMCAALEGLGLIESFDVIYGSSAGAINASYTAAGQARMRAGLYVVAARARVIDLRRAVLLRPPFRLSAIRTEVLDAHPHDRSVLTSTQSLKVTAARVEDKGLDVLGGFRSLDALRAALLASCANPILAGQVVEFRGRRYADGGLIESVPFRVAFREGATHVLVLRSRHAGYRAPDFRGACRHALKRLLRGAPGKAAEMVFEWPAIYNADARELQAAASGELAARLTQLTPPADRRSTSSYEPRPGRLWQRIALGEAAVHRAFADAMHRRDSGMREAA